jgi:hypothetical protein
LFPGVSGEGLETLWNFGNYPVFWEMGELFESLKLIKSCPIHPAKLSIPANPVLF